MAPSLDSRDAHRLTKRKSIATPASRGASAARHTGPADARHARAGRYRTKGMSIFVPARYAGYAAGNVAVRFFSSTDAE